MRTDFEYLRDDDLPDRLDCTYAEAAHVLLVGLLRPMNTHNQTRGILPSYLSEDLRTARLAIAEARESGQPFGHDHREAPKAPARKAANPDAEPSTVTIESEEMPEMESDVQEMMTEVFG